MKYFHGKDALGSPSKKSLGNLVQDTAPSSPSHGSINLMSAVLGHILFVFLFCSFPSGSENFSEMVSNESKVEVSSEEACIEYPMAALGQQEVKTNTCNEQVLITRGSLDDFLF